MTDYTKLVEALRGMDNGDSCPCEYYMMCEDSDCVLVQAAAAIEELQQIADHHEQTAKDYWKEACEYKAQLPKRGEWINSKERMRPDMCSVCGCVYEADRFMDKIAWNYCPNCGAKMGGTE